MLRFLIFGFLFLNSFASMEGQRNNSSRDEEPTPPAKAESHEDEALSSYVLVEEETEGVLPSRQVSVTKLPSSLEQLPVSVGVVSERLFNFQRAEVLGQALENVSGAASHTGFGVFDYFVIRGFDSLSNGLVLIDGAPEPEATFYHLYNVNRVEVLKGPGGFLYGGNPLAASINLVRKGPLFENAFQLGASLGSFDTIRGTLDLNRVNSAKDVAFRMNAFGRSSNGYRDSTDNWQVGVNPSLSFQLGQKNFLTVNFEYVRNEYHSDSGIPIVNNQIPDVPRTRSYQSPFDLSDQNIYRTRIDFSRVLSNSAVFRNKFYYTDLAWKSNGTIFPAVYPAAPGQVDVYRSLLRLDDHQRLFGNQSELWFRLHTGPVLHDFITGLEVSSLFDTFTLDIAGLPPIDLYNPVETAEPPLHSIPGLGQAGDTRNLVVAPYLLDQMSVSDRLRFLLGGRLDGIDFRETLSSLERDHLGFSPILGCSYSLFPDLALYGNFGQAFAPPSSQVVGERKPEESVQYEFGAKKQIGESYSFGLAFFDLTRNNIAIPDETGFLRQQGDQRSQGIEFDMTGELDTGLFLLASYAFTEAELTRFTELVDYSFGQLPPLLVDRSGNRPAFAPKHIAGLSLIKEFGTGFSLGINGRYLSKQFIAANNEFAIDGSLVIGTTAAYRVDNWKLILNLKNLTGTHYETRGFGSTSVIAGDAFAVYLGVEFLR